MNINSIPLKINQTELENLRSYMLINGSVAFESFSYIYNFKMAFKAYGFEPAVKFINHNLSTYLVHSGPGQAWSDFAQPLVVSYDRQRDDYFIWCHVGKIRFKWSKGINVKYQKTGHEGHQKGFKESKEFSYYDVFNHLLSTQRPNFSIGEHKFLSISLKQLGWYRTQIYYDSVFDIYILVPVLLGVSYDKNSSFSIDPAKSLNKSELKYPLIGPTVPITTARWFDRLLHSMLHGQGLMITQPMIQIHTTYGLSLFAKTLVQSFGVQRTIEIFKESPSLYTDLHGNGIWFYRQISEYPEKDDWQPEFYTYNPTDSRIGKRVSTQQTFLDKSCGNQRCNYLNVQREIRDNARKGLITIAPWIDRVTKKPILYFDLGQEHIENGKIYHFGSGMTWRIIE